MSCHHAIHTGLSEVAILVFLRPSFLLLLWGTGHIRVPKMVVVDNHGIPFNGTLKGGITYCMSIALLIITKVGAPPPLTVSYIQSYRSSRIMMTDDRDQVSTDSACRPLGPLREQRNLGLCESTCMLQRNGNGSC